MVETIGRSEASFSYGSWEDRGIKGYSVLWGTVDCTVSLRNSGINYILTLFNFEIYFVADEVRQIQTKYPTFKSLDCVLRAEKMLYFKFIISLSLSIFSVKDFKQNM